MILRLTLKQKPYLLKWSQSVIKYIYKWQNTDPKFDLNEKYARYNKYQTLTSFSLVVYDFNNQVSLKSYLEKFQVMLPFAPLK